MEFYLSQEQESRINDWMKSLPEISSKYHTIDGGYYEYIFTPIGTGTLVTVKRIDGNELDVTDYKSLL